MNVNCVCKKNPDACECSIQINCSCQKSNKIPLIQQRFMYLQRELRMNKIGTVDKKETYKLSSRIERQKYTVKRQPEGQKFRKTG